ncbi:tetratricopeptide repeat-containing sulfotransferase family protein [Kordiimonas pumila]|uniref:Tetratricopeptide repeat-containing sulfotransferase family protein n=1 Tax=Kordiimonas pumila TaxID=2161677 RepID=A0ABV7D9F5_9PROT|nr:tetratricopeptide repeat-containing sulfotransferase family protein [Kordiimonas pumila]
MDDKTTQASLKTAQAHIYKGQFEVALAVLSSLDISGGNGPDILYMKAVCERYGKQYAAAGKTLRALFHLAPEFGRGYQELGYLRLAENDQTGAFSAFSKACQYNPALEASWRSLAELQKNMGRQVEADQALAQANRLKALPKELFAVTNYIYEGKLLRAENLCRRYLQANPKNVEAMRLLADIGRRFGVLEEADFLLESALAFDPENIQVRLDYIHILRQRQKFDAALKEARALYEREPNNPVFQSHYAIEALQAGDFDTAFSMFDSVLERIPNDPATLTSKGHALKTVGKQDAAIEAYRAACISKPDHGDAYYGLANLKTYRFTDDELGRMTVQEASPDISHMSRIQLCFSLGKAYEDRKEYDRSFGFYERGNDLKRAQSRYDADQMAEELDAQADVCNGELFAKHKGAGCSAADPIFIVGLPRAGSTLLEQILASHSQVDGTLELPNILSLSHRLRDRQKVSSEASYPRILHSLSAEKLQELGETYIRETQVHRSGAPYFTDKMPNNFRHIGLIKLILPNAKIIDARRNPMACCFSGFKQLFAEGQEFTYGLTEIGRYYKSYTKLMDHWHSVLPGQILHVQYEDVVDDLETQVQRILDYCGLPFESACVNFHKTERSVRTASSEQVRQPINKSGLEQWHHFDSYLGPLREALGPLASP